MTRTQLQYGVAVVLTLGAGIWLIVGVPIAMAWLPIAMLIVGAVVLKFAKKGTSEENDARNAQAVEQLRAKYADDAQQEPSSEQ